MPVFAISQRSIVDSMTVGLSALRWMRYAQLITDPSRGVRVHFAVTRHRRVPALR